MDVAGKALNLTSNGVIVVSDASFLWDEVHAA